MVLAFALVPGRAARKIRLVLSPLRVREIRTIVLVDGQAESALEAPDVVLEEVGVFVEIDRLKG